MMSIGRPLMPHEERVAVEHMTLEERISKLKAFVDTDVFSKLPVLERILLTQQLAAMMSYEAALSARIQLWK